MVFGFNKVNILLFSGLTEGDLPVILTLQAIILIGLYVNYKIRINIKNLVSYLNPNTTTPLGDLRELYDSKVKTEGKFRATFWLISEIGLSILPITFEIIRQKIKSSFKIVND